MFDIVNHLNTGRTLLDHQEDRVKLAELNLQAGKKAKASTAYFPALQHFTTRTTLLPEDGWESHYELAFALYRERYECEYLTAHFEAAEKLFTLILTHAGTDIEKAEIYNIRIVQYTMIARYEEAVKMGWKSLKLIGVELPEHDVQMAIERELEEARMNLGQRRIADLIHMPVMTDPAKQESVKLLLNMRGPAYFIDPDLHRLIIGRTVNIVLKYGTTQEAPYAYTGYGIILGAVLKEYQSGYEFGKLAIQLSEQLNDAVQKCRAFHVFAGWLNHWRMPVKSDVTLERQAFQYGLEAGELQYAGYSFVGLINALLSKGDELGSVLEELEKAGNFIDKTKNTIMRNFFAVWRQFILNLQRQTKGTKTFNEQYFQESQFLKNAQKDPQVICHFYIFKLQSFYLYEHYTEALRMAIDGEQALAYIAGMLTEAEHNFYYSLSLTALYFTANREEQHHYRETLRAYQQQMKTWAENCPENFQHKYLLVKAEIAKIEGRNWDAVECYRKAIEEARRHEFVQNAALGNELLAKFWLIQGEEKLARVYMLEAYHGYQRWGAKGKVKDLEKRYPQLFTRTRPFAILTTTEKTPPYTETHLGRTLDLSTVLKASQTISGEIVLEHLLSRLMEIVMENAGAERGVLLLEEDNEWVVKAEQDARLERVDTERNLEPVEGLVEGFSKPFRPEVPATIINYVARTHEPVVLGDAVREGPFTQDRYISVHQPRSVLCTPLLHQGTLKGILYLENTLTAEAFTPERLEILTLLSSQAAISIENATLYTTLEQKVEERTVELMKAKDAAEEAQRSAEEARQAAEAANQAKSEFLSRMSHELRTPLNAILGYTQLLKCDKEVMDSRQEALETIHQSGDHLLMLINDLLDLSRIEARVIELNPTNLHLLDFLKGIAAMIHLQAHQKNITFECDLSGTDLPTIVQIDEKRLRQILLNLLNNAIKFTEKGRVMLRVNARSTVVSEYWSTGKESTQITPPTLQHSNTPILQRSNTPTFLSFQVEDTGVGIQSDQLEDIFLPFHQVGATQTRGLGVGLGLAISRQLVRMMGSELQVRSTVGEGTTFWFDLELSVVKSSQIYAEPNASAPAAALPIVFPPQEDLKTLIEFAKIGDITEIQDYTAKLRETDRQFFPFADKIDQLAGNF